MCKESTNTVGLKVVKIACDDSNYKIKKLSELGQNWSIPSKCPCCNRVIEFTKENINQLFCCKCGQKIKLEIPENLL